MVSQQCVERFRRTKKLFPINRDTDACRDFKNTTHLFKEKSSRSVSRCCRENFVGLPDDIHGGPEESPQHRSRKRHKQKAFDIHISLLAVN
jgi:hypothetical protein